MNHTGRSIAIGAGLALAIGLTTGILGLMAISLGAVKGEIGMGIGLRTALELFALVCLVAYAARRWPDHGLGTFLAAAAAGYLLNPLAWTGQALLSAAVLPGGPVTFVTDLVLWLAVTAGVVTMQARRPERVVPDADVRELLR